MELFITHNGVAEQYTSSAVYRLCEYKGEAFEDAYGKWRRTLFLHSTQWVLYYKEQGDTDLLSLAKQWGGDFPHPYHLLVVPILPADIETALSYGAVIGVEYIDGMVELVAVFQEDDTSGDWLANHLNTPVDFYDKRHFFGFVEHDTTLHTLYNDNNLTPNGVLGIWTGRQWAVYVR